MQDLQFKSVYALIAKDPKARTFDEMLPLLDAFRTINWMDLRIEMEKMGFV